MKEVTSHANLNFDLEYYENIIKPLLNSHDAENWAIEYGRGINTYLDRINKIGLAIDGLVLDAGGGAGNWSIPLALVNKHVDLVDVNDSRLLIANRMLERLSIQNITPCNMSIEKMDFPNDHHDLIICYSVIMFTNVQRTLNEFYRVLKPDGRLYLQADLWRWYFGQGYSQVNKFKYLRNLIKNKVIHNRPAILTKNRLISMVRKAGFKILATGQDGETSFLQDNKVPDPKRFCDPRPVNREELIEICALKQ